ncbi:MAG: ribonuclease HI [Alphaproteobacteria bacterium]|nr:ribonuclease HI [Alphaproteobacteria bacterium]
MLKIWTDGSCLGNPGPGGWAFVMTDSNQTIERSGGEQNTTNNKMELTAVIKALSVITKNKEIEIHTDSQYVKNGMQSWLIKWKKNNWKTADKKPVKNQELWQQLDELSNKFIIHWIWVKGHAGETFNERVDTLARNEAEKLK